MNPAFFQSLGSTFERTEIIIQLGLHILDLIGHGFIPHNFLLMHAMGPDVAGVIGSAVAAGVLLALVK